MRFLLLFSFIAAIAGISSCVQGPPQYPIEPNIAFKSVSKDTLLSGDSLTVTLTFTDGDGDIGTDLSTSPQFNSPLCDLFSDSSVIKDPYWSLILIDHRDSCPEARILPFVEPTGKFDDLSGEIDFYTSLLECKIAGCSGDPACVEDKLVYTVLIKDRKGHLSNPVVTPPITIRCK
jgi:hypothetical protein